MAPDLCHILEDESKDVCDFQGYLSFSDSWSSTCTCLALSRPGLVLPHLLHSLDNDLGSFLRVPLVLFGSVGPLATGKVASLAVEKVSMSGGKTSKARADHTHSLAHCPTILFDRPEFVLVELVAPEVS